MAQTTESDAMNRRTNTHRGFTLLELLELLDVLDVLDVLDIKAVGKPWKPGGFGDRIPVLSAPRAQGYARPSVQWHAPDPGRQHRFITRPCGAGFGTGVDLAKYRNYFPARPAVRSKLSLRDDR